VADVAAAALTAAKPFTHNLAKITQVWRSHGKHPDTLP
jgi:hypothetical protein